MKPKGRIMQISTTNWQDLIVLTVLCEDGSVWSKINGEWSEWELDFISDNIDDNN